jgi:hypothetical protein
MKHIGVREFKDRANALLSADEPLIIERHGRAIGAYIPFGQPDREAAANAAKALTTTLDALYAQTGMTEDDLVAEFLRDDDIKPGR